MGLLGRLAGAWGRGDGRRDDELDGDGHRDDELDGDGRRDDELDDDERPLVRTREELRERLSGSGLADRAEELVALARDSIRLVPVVDPEGLDTPDTPAAGAAAAGRHRLGGHPDLPPGTPWPRVEGRPLAFIAQVGLGSLIGLDPEGLLPRTGTLCFFHEVDEETHGLLPAPGASPVLLLPGDGLVPTAPPDDLPGEARFRPVALSPEPELTVPGSEAEVLAAALPVEEDQGLFTALAGYDESLESAPHHRLLGHADEVQGSVAWEAEHEASGGSRRRMSREAVLRWRLLLQVDSDEDGTGMQWGDVGRLYWMVREEDLRAGRFDRTVTIAQTY